MPEYLIVKIIDPGHVQPLGIQPPENVTPPRPIFNVVGIVEVDKVADHEQALAGVPVPAPHERIVLLRWDQRTEFETDPGFRAIEDPPSIEAPPEG
jgi:hypothetical protein